MFLTLILKNFQKLIKLI